MPVVAPPAASAALFRASRGIVPRIARRGVESSERLGRHRWVVERTLAWLNRFRRLTVRYERRADIHQAFLSLGCSLICWQALNR
jgi:transposase